MALAFLLSKYVKTYQGHRIADNPPHNVLAITVDHRLRRESAAEAAKVAQNIKSMGMKAAVVALDWSKILGADVDPRTQPNMESLARTLRYRTMGAFFARQNVMSLFFGHHRDDQHETVLMRLLSGHGYRGLQGMHKANSIPECYDIDGAYKSGLLDDQLRKHPYLKFSPAGREMRALRSRLRLESTLPGFDQFRSYLGVNDLSAQFPGHLHHDFDPNLPYLPPLNIEDGGITVYRPLLDFDKSRLIATCEANRITWFEDPTNADPTLTTRNALRRLCREHQLPKALQKSSIIALAARLRQRVREEEAEASRILAHQATIVDFDPNVGSLVVDLPSLNIGRSIRRHHNKMALSEARRGRQRILAAIVTRKIINFVTPDNHLPRISNLENTLRRLFPLLYEDDPTLLLGGKERKGFSIAGVQFDPVPSYKSTRWFLSRAPFSSNHLRMVTESPEVIGGISWRKNDGLLPWQALNGAGWRTLKVAHQWDGRFWIRLSSCDRRLRLHLLPFMASHSKEFKASLSSKERARFEKLLRYHAPGKVRYTLPGVYSVQRQRRCGDVDNEPPQRMRLLALPTLGVHIAGLEQSVRYEARYKNVDMTLLGKGKDSKKLRANRFMARISLSRRQRRQRLRRKAYSLV